MSAAPAHYRAPTSTAHPSPGSPDTDNDDAYSSADESGADAGAPPRKRARRDHHDGGPVGGGGPARPLSVSCETCKLRKVKCDRGQPSCGWCLKNAQVCEYKERKKPGLRAGYGRELESKLSEQAAMLSTCARGWDRG
jgi:Fungal Zn(2)-Cys(6) binuclear cluster domain